ncbi:MAG: helix-turn-helix transcriptional regulator [Clostridiaceae bacterium]|nr:helix-turn-helix transcriptional regulator [Clostridiaceae bacterium]
MSMNQVIREKRKELGLTQEQMADRLSVTAPAVNKWEKGATCPDVALLPALARLLGIDVNTLLCFQEGPSEREITHICRGVMDVIRQDGFARGFALGMEKIREYPGCGPLLHSMAMLLDGAMMMSGMKPDEKENYDHRITELYERAAESGDGHVQNNAVFMLASKYMGREEYDKAQEMIDRLPEKNAADKRQLQASLLLRRGESGEAGKLLERKLLQEINGLQIILVMLADIAMKEGREEDAARLAEISRAAVRLFGLWDYSGYVVPLQVAIARKDECESLDLLRSILAAALAPWDRHDSPLYRHIFTAEPQESFGKLMLPGLLAELENDPKSAFLWDNPEFRQMIRQYRAEC